MRAVDAVLAGGGVLALVAQVVVAILLPFGTADSLEWIAVYPVPALACGLLLWWMRPDHPVAVLLLANGVLTALESLAEGATDLADVRGADGWLWAGLLGMSMLESVGVLVALRLFGLLPDGRAHHGYERVVLGVFWALPLLDVLEFLTNPVPELMYPTRLIANPVYLAALEPLRPAITGIYSVLDFGVLPAILGMFAARYWRGTAEDRRRMKWILLGLILLTASYAASWGLDALGLVRVGSGNFAEVVLFLPIALMPVSVVIATVRHQLIDVDLAIRRTAVYAVVSFAIIGAYVGLAVALGIAVADRAPVGLAALATVAATLALQPVRRWLDAAVARLVFGRRLTGPQLLARFGQTIEQVFDLSELAPRLAEGLRAGLDARWATVTLHGPAGPVVATAPPDAHPHPPDRQIPLVHAGATLGSLTCGPKTAGRYTSADDELLATLARQAAVAVHNVTLAAELAQRLAQIGRQAAELAASRARIVHAADLERRRIERDIHDGVQQEIFALVAKLRLARNRLRRDPAGADTLLAQLQDDARATLDCLRSLAHGIHPPVLTDHGLLAAVRAHTARLPIGVDITADSRAQNARHPAHVEAAAYFVVSEALTNVVKHAAAAHTTVTIACPDGRLRVEIADDGVGFDPEAGHRAGSGLTGLRDRVEALGGHIEVTSQPGRGCRLAADLPAPAGAGTTDG